MSKIQEITADKLRAKFKNINIDSFNPQTEAEKFVFKVIQDLRQKIELDIDNYDGFLSVVSIATSDYIFQSQMHKQDPQLQALNDVYSNRHFAVDIDFPEPKFKTQGFIDKLLKKEPEYDTGRIFNFTVKISIPPDAE